MAGAAEARLAGSARARVPDPDLWGSRHLGVIAVRRDRELQLVGHLLMRNRAGLVDVYVGAL